MTNQTFSATESAAPGQSARVPHTAAIVHLFAVIAGITEVLLVINDVDSPVRIWLAIALFLVGPGSGLTQFLRLPDAALQIAVIIGLSLSIDLFVAQSLLWAHNLNGDAAVCILAGVTFLRPPPAARNPSIEPTQEMNA